MTPPPDLVLVLVHAAIWVPIAAVVAVAMDAWAGLLHGAVWHRWLWSIHRSHHRPRAGRFEVNDVLALAHAPIAIALILYGCQARSSVLREVAFGVGVGMTAFALGYIIVHDGLVHGRLPGVQFLLRVAPLRRIVRAHRVHHLVPKEEEGQSQVPFSLFFGPWELRQRQQKRRRQRRREGLLVRQSGASHHVASSSPSRPKKKKKTTTTTTTTT